MVDQRSKKVNYYISYNEQNIVNTSVNVPQTSRITRSVPSISEIEQHSGRVLSHQGERDHTPSHGSSERLEHMHTTAPQQPSEEQK